MANLKPPRYEMDALDFAAHMAADALSECMLAINEAADEIWKSMRKWGGDPTSRDNHAIDCQCTYCT